MMRRLLLAGLFCFFSYTTTFAAPIFISIPEATLQDVAHDITPLELHPKGSLQGKIYITEITNLTLADNLISCSLSLAGKEMKISTKLGDTPISLDVGEVSTQVAANLELQYNKSREEIVLIPRIKNITGKSDKDELASMLLSLLDGQKFPIALNDLPPIIGGKGEHPVELGFDLVDISVEQDKITALIEPIVSRP